MNEIRKLKIKGEVIDYAIRRSIKAKHLQLRITGTGILEIIVPNGCSYSYAMQFFSSKKDWIEKHLNHLRKKDDRFFYLGKHININLKVYEGKRTKYLKSENEIVVTTGIDKSKNYHYSRFLLTEAKNYFPDKLHYWSKIIGVNPTDLKIRGQKTRWGSCSRRGSISLNYKLMKFREEIIDYVIIHELCHIKHFNHSKAYWKEVEKYCKNWKEFKKELKHGISNH